LIRALNDHSLQRQKSTVLMYSTQVTRATIIFTGDVQGVGFRYTAFRIAANFALTGWVKNEPDGTVLCTLEGEPDEIERFLTALQQAMRNHIDETRVEHSPATGEFRDFAIRR
jgi:acylphosphatase